VAQLFSLGRLRFMTKYTDKEWAAFILDVRQNGGKLRKGFWKRHKLFIPVSVLLAFGIVAHFWWLCWFLAGAVFTVFMRDGAWMRALQDAWSVCDKVIDWSKVEKITNGDSAA